MMIFADSRGPIFNSRDPNRVPKHLKKNWFKQIVPRLIEQNDVIMLRRGPENGSYLEWFEPALGCRAFKPSNVFMFSGTLFQWRF